MNNAQATRWNTPKTCRSCGGPILLLGCYWACEREHGNLTGREWKNLPKAIKLPKRRFCIQGKDGLWKRLLHHDGKSSAKGQVVAAYRGYGEEYAVAMTFITYTPLARRIPYVRGMRCHVFDCTRRAAQGCRGMCKACATKARALKKSGEAPRDDTKMKPATRRQNGRDHMALQCAITARRVANDFTSSTKERGVGGVCSVPGCDRETLARALCKSCYNSATREIRDGRTTWDELEWLGLAVKPAMAPVASPGAFE
jgi:hypothetical protein